MTLSRSLTLLLLAAALPAARAALPLTTQPVVMLSDIHLDPFSDPAKFPALLAAPAAGWKAIFDAPATPTQAADFERLQAACNAKGIDTPIALLESALAAAQAQQPRPLFIAIPGDLMAHKFDCKFKELARLSTGHKLGEAAYSAFAAKTVAFVALQLHLTFPGVPIYFALGNNDSGCRDYDEDPGSAFLQADGEAFAADMLTPPYRTAVAKGFSQYGDYNAPLPIAHTRLLVMQDIFESTKFTTCNGTANADPGAAQIAWLRSQLTAARDAHEQVWVMAHIPPGIDAYSTFTKGRDACKGGAPEKFLATDDLAATIAQFPDVIRLALFGHTHMDEMRVYKSADGTPIPGKLVPSISPVNGNTPAFTIAQVSPSTASLVDYTVYTATTGTGWTPTTKWLPNYTYSTTYKLPDLSGPSLDMLLSGFVADKGGNSEPALSYEKYFFAGDPAGGAGKAAMRAAAMKIVWPIYACSMTKTSTAGYQACLCPAAP